MHKSKLQLTICVANENSYNIAKPNLNTLLRFEIAVNLCSWAFGIQLATDNLRK